MSITAKVKEIMDAIEGDRGVLLATVAGLSESQFAWQPTAGQWSVVEILQHLALVEEANGKLCSMMLKKAVDEHLPQDTSPDASVMDDMERLKQHLTDRTNKVPAPERVQPLHRCSGAEVLVRLKVSREKLREIVSQLSAYDLTRLKWPHPFFGDMNLYEWIMMIGLHESRHTRQIEEIRARADFRGY